MHDTSKLSNKIRDRESRVRENKESFEPKEFMEPTSLADRRRLKDREPLSLSDTIDIVIKIKFKWIPSADVAKEYRVSIQTISQLMRKAHKDPLFVRDLANKKWERERAREKVVDVMAGLLDQDLHISSVAWLREHLKETKDIDVKDWILRDIMKNELDLRYKRIKQISFQGNSDRNKILRQRFALTQLEIDPTKRVILNVDE